MDLGYEYFCTAKFKLCVACIYKHVLQKIPNNSQVSSAEQEAKMQAAEREAISDFCIFHLPNTVLCRQIMENPTTEVSVSFCQLLKKMAVHLKFDEPEYHIIDTMRNTSYLSLKADDKGISYVYVGGEAQSIENSYESANEQVVRDLMLRFHVCIRDITYARNMVTEERAFLYSLKRLELQAIEASINGVVDILQTMEPPTKHVVLLSIDFMQLFMEICKRLSISCGTIEVVRKRHRVFVSWVIFEPSPKIAQAHTIFSDECRAAVEAVENLAEKAIIY